MASSDNEIPLEYWLAAFQYRSRCGGRDVTAESLQQALSLPSRRMARLILKRMNEALQSEVVQTGSTAAQFSTIFPSAVGNADRGEASTPAERGAVPSPESWLLMDAFWDRNG